MFRALPRYDARHAPRGVGLLLTSGPQVPLVVLAVVAVVFVGYLRRSAARIANTMTALPFTPLRAARCSQLIPLFVATSMQCVAGRHVNPFGADTLVEPAACTK